MLMKNIYFLFIKTAFTALTLKDKRKNLFKKIPPTPF